MTENKDAPFAPGPKNPYKWVSIDFVFSEED